METKLVSYEGPKPTWIARRVLEDAEGQVEVRLGVPMQSSEADIWHCPIEFFEQGKPPCIYRAAGLDQFQALGLAMEGIRVALADSGRSFQWLGMEPGFTGFSAAVSTGFGQAFVMHLEGILERETAKWVEDLANRPVPMPSVPNDVG